MLSAEGQSAAETVPLFVSGAELAFCLPLGNGTQMVQKKYLTFREQGIILSLKFLLRMMNLGSQEDS